jgi:hypothetical protein
MIYMKYKIMIAAFPFLLLGVAGVTSQAYAWGYWNDGGGDYSVENVDIKTAAINLARDLEDYKQAMSDLKAEGLRIRDLTKLAERKMDDDYANNLIWGDNW